MTQRIFDVDNEKDMADLWDILPDGFKKISCNKLSQETSLWSDLNLFTLPIGLIKINWHDKKEIERPIQEATEADVGKLCVFWNDKSEEFFGRLGHIGDKYYTMIAPVYEDLQFFHCRRLTKQEIEELI